MSDQAIFLDRDGTLIHPVHFASHPDQIQMVEGISAHLRVFQDAGWRLIVITNQSGIARGYFDEPALDRMHDRLREQLTAQQVELDAVYYCPHHPEGSVPVFASDCDCRKPQPGMIHQAATDFNLDLSASWLIGDILDDVEAGHRAGCRTVLVDLGTETMPETRERRPDYVARDTAHALSLIRAEAGLGTSPETTYRPERWSGLANAARKDVSDAGHD